MAAPLDLPRKELVEVITASPDGTLPPSGRASPLTWSGAVVVAPASARCARPVRVVRTLGDQPDEPVPEATKRRLLDMFRAWKRT
jgi:hypothetical protein